MSHVLWRLATAVPVLFGVLLAGFVLTRILPGDPAVFFAANPAMSVEDVAQLRADLGLDAPLGVQFLTYLGALARGDLGYSVSTGQPVGAELARRLPASLELALAGFVLAFCLAVPLGIAAALRPGSLLDRCCRVVASLGTAVPVFVTGLLLIWLFYALAGIAPEPVGRLDPFRAPPPAVTGFMLVDTALAGDGAAFRAALARLVLPALTMAIFALAPLMRVTRAAMIAALGSEHVRAARALGLSQREVVLGHALLPALGPVVTVSGLTFAYMMGANILVERVFAWPGIGRYAIDSALALDHAPVQGVLLAMAAVIVTVNLVTDLVQIALDPRLRGR